MQHLPSHIKEPVQLQKVNEISYTKDGTGMSRKKKRDNENS